MFGSAPEDDEDGFGSFNRFNLNDFLEDTAQYEDDLAKLEDFYDNSNGGGKLLLKNGKANNGTKSGGGSRKSKKQF